MNSLYKRLAKSLLASFLFFSLPTSLKAQTTLVTGDIAFTGYISNDPVLPDQFSFVLLKNISTNTVIKFTDYGWRGAAFGSGINLESEITFTAGSNFIAGTEIKIAGTNATLLGGGSAGTIVYSGGPSFLAGNLSLSSVGDQLFAYQGTFAAPSFISGIHMNVYTIANGDPTNTDASNWDGVLSGIYLNINTSEKPAALSTGTNAIWIGTTGDINSDRDNGHFICGPDVSTAALARAAINNPANWFTSNATAGFTLPTGCNYLNALTPSISVTGTPLSAFTACSGTASAEQNFIVSGNALTSNIDINAPAGFEISLTSGSGFGVSLSLVPSGGVVNITTIYVRLSASATGSPAGNITLTSTGATTINIPVTGTVSPVPTVSNAGPDNVACGLTYTLAGNTATTGIGTWTLVSGPGTASFADPNLATTSVTVSVEGAYTFRWSITSGFCPASTDDVVITFSAIPSVAAAGPDQVNICTSPGSAVMAGNVPAVGTGTWTQTAGPVSAAIVSPAQPNTTINGLTTAGTYTFRWTISNGSCTASFDEMDVVVNSNPAAFTIGGGGVTVCVPGTTLSGPVDPNYSYQWGRSLTGAPFANMGTAQTQAVTASGNYQLVVTNQFGCTATATTTVNVADYVFNGSLGAGDAQQTGRINRFGIVSTCAAPKVCPGIFSAVGARFYDSYTITNIRSVPVCATIGINSGCGTNIFNVAYLGSFNPAALCTNYLGDPGSSFPASGFMEVTIPANATIVVVVHEVNAGTGCSNYTLTVDVPREAAAVTVVPPSVPCNGTSTLTASLANTYLWSPGGATTQSFTTPPLFINTTYTVTLGYGNNGCTTTASGTVTVTSVAPTIICPGNITQSNSIGQCGSIVSYITTAGGTPVPTVTYSFTGATTGSGSGDGSGSFFNVGTTTVTVTVTNSCGTANCSFTVTVNDTQPPTITCPAPVTVSCSAAVPPVNIASVTASDNCPGVVVTHISDVISAQTCANRYILTRTYRATDAAGNIAQCTQIITVNDITPPTLTCPAPVTVSCTSLVPAPNIAAVTGVSDNCAGVVTVTFVSDVISNQTCANRYTITRTYRATDVCGNFAQCTQIITVNDITPPTLTCPAPVTVSCASLVPAPNIASVTGVSDNCGGVVTVTFISDVISNQTCANRYTITRTYRATDVCGNFSECTQVITVNDITPPTLTCPAPVTVSCASAVPAPNIASVTGVSDNCGGVVTVTFVSDVISNQTCANRYTITRTYRATDVCGNFAQCTQIITVNDQTAPVITCPANITVTTPIGSCTAVVTYSVTATDNCAGAVTIVTVPASGSVFPIGTTTVTSTATDVCGNSSTCSFTVTVIDGQLPVISTQPANRTVCAGTNAAFNVVSTNAVSYQWQSWNGSAWVNIAGANSSSFTVNNTTLSMNTNSYRVLVIGLCTTVTSGVATLYVNALPTISLTASPVPVLLPTQSTNITATVNPPGGSFVWLFNGSPMTGITGPSIGPLTVDNIGSYRAIYTDLNGCVATSAAITVSGAISDHLFIYPNPNTGHFHIRVYNQPNEEITVRIFDMKGAQVYLQKVITAATPYTDIEVELMSDRITSGETYIVEVRGTGGRLIGSKKIIVYK